MYQRALVLLFLLPLAFSAIYVANDRDWRLPFLLGYYATATDNYFFALVSPEEQLSYTAILERFLERAAPGEEIIIYEGPDPVIPNYEAVLRPKGIRVRTVRYSNIQDLMFALPSQLGFTPRGALLVPDGVGPWLLASAPYAFREGLAIYLIDNRVIDRLSSLPYDRIVIVGYNGRRLLQAYPNAEHIATGNKYKDSVEIAKKFKTSQVYVMSGLYLYVPALPEKSLYFTGSGGRYPILISYLDRLPDPVRDYLVEHNEIRFIAFVGPELVQVFQWAKKELTPLGKKPMLYISVKYPNIPGKAPGRDYYPPSIVLPSGDIALRVESVRILPDRVFVIVRNLGKGSGYFVITRLSLDCEGIRAELGPTQPQFVGGGEAVSVILESNTTMPAGRQCKVNVEGFFGADVDTMTLRLEGSFNVTSEAPGEDPTEVELLGLKYWPSLERVAVRLKNASGVTAFAQARFDLYVDGVKRPFQTNIIRLRPGEERTVYVRAYLTDADILDNENVNVNLFYGKDSTLLFKLKKYSLPLEKATFTDELIRFVQENTLLVGVLILIIIILFILRRR